MLKGLFRMSDHPANWHIYTQGDPVLKPRRRNIFFKGRRRSDRWMARLMLLMGLTILGLGLKMLWTDVPEAAHPVLTVSLSD